MRAHEHEKRPAEVEQEKPRVEAEQEEESKTKFVANGNVPPIGGEFKENAGSTQQAFEDLREHERELKQKVNELVQTRFDGDLKRAFEHYDLDNNGSVDKGEIVNLLADASVGTKQTREIIAAKLVDKGDASRARGGELELEWAEFESEFKGRTAAPT